MAPTSLLQEQQLLNLPEAPEEVTLSNFAQTSHFMIYCFHSPYFSFASVVQGKCSNYEQNWPAASLFMSINRADYRLFGSNSCSSCWPTAPAASRHVDRPETQTGSVFPQEAAGSEEANHASQVGSSDFRVFPL